MGRPRSGPFAAGQPTPPFTPAGRRADVRDSAVAREAAEGRAWARRIAERERAEQAERDAAIDEQLRRIRDEAKR